MDAFDWASSVTYVLTDWTFLTILCSTGTGNEAICKIRKHGRCMDPALLRYSNVSTTSIT